MREGDLLSGEKLDECVFEKEKMMVKEEREIMNDDGV